MRKINKELKFRHFIIDRKGTIFVSARDADNKVYNFLITHTSIMQQVNSHFEFVNDELAEYIRRKVESCYGIVPIYKIKYIDVS
jgi:hypothetical protein